MSARAKFTFPELLEFKPVYSTTFGRAYCADSRELLRSLPDSSVHLVITSPPFALRKKKSYGNVSASEYIEWFWPFAEQIFRVLKPKGSFVLDIGGSWNKGEPTRSLYHYELLLQLCGEHGLFKLAQEFYWYNRAKMPAPAEWVTIQRVRVKDAVQPIWWLGKTARPTANNRWVLTPYKDGMKKLLKNGYNSGLRPSGHVVSTGWNCDQGGAIPPNIIEASNTRSYDTYLSACRRLGIEVHPARFDERVPEFFIKFLTRPGYLVVDPFAGSNIVGRVAESLKRYWIGIEIQENYSVSSAFRFENIGEELLRSRHEQSIDEK